MLCRFPAFGDEPFHDVGCLLDQQIDFGPLLCRETAQHKIRRVHSARWTSNSTFETPELSRSERLDDRASPVVASRPAVILKTQPRKGQIDVVVDNQEVVPLDVEVAHEGRDRLTRVVHEGRRHGEDGSDTADAGLADLGPDGPPGALESEIPATGKRQQHLFTEVVTSLVVALTWIAQAND